MSSPRPTRELVLLADDEMLSREFMAEALGSLDVDVRCASDGTEALHILSEESVDYVFTDLVMPGHDGLEVLAASKQQDSGRPVILVTAHGTMGVAVESMRKGADDILEKPASPDDLALALHRARERRRLVRENRFLRAESVGGDLLVASPAMNEVVDLVKRVAPSTASVLITGESGTGKERIAALLHRCSDRGQGPFVKINCAAIPEALMEAEFFGHEAGAFTGATERRAGRFELADGGTLFLDEVGEMSPTLQAKLLRVLQEGEFSRVGGNRTLTVDVRIVAATNRNLQAQVRKGLFREDLYYRLNVVPIEVPPLRDRIEDVLPLARSFVSPDVEISEDAAIVLRAFDWPGNVRELQNVMQRASLLCRDNVIDRDLLSSWVNTSVQAAAPHPPRDTVQNLVGRPLRAIEHDVIRATLAHCHGNRSRAAEMLGISVRTLFNRLKSSAPPTRVP